MTRSTEPRDAGPRHRTIADDRRSRRRPRLRRLRRRGGRSGLGAAVVLLRERLDETRKTLRPLGTAAARERLARVQAAEARPDPSQVHPSWWVRALRDESPAVGLAVARSAPEPIAGIVRRALGLAEPPTPDRPPVAVATASAVALWAERLVGGLVWQEYDPPVVRAIARLDPRGRFRLLAAAGLAKRTYADTIPEDSDRLRPRVASLRPLLPAARDELVLLCRRDVEATDGRRSLRLDARLGLVTAGRLLAIVEPHRARWALQHLPYEVAKRVRASMRLRELPATPAEVLAMESALLTAAAASLAARGRLDPMDLAEPDDWGPSS